MENTIEQSKYLSVITRWGQKALLHTQATYDPISNIEKLQTFMPDVFCSLSSCYLR